jgi:hypothetical protein
VLLKVGVIIFYFIRFLSKKNNQIKLKKKTETGSNKTHSNRFGLVFPVWLGFFPVWLGFFFRFFFCLGSIQFFRFQVYKTKPVSFFKILIGFFHGSVFSVIFFSGFLGLIDFLVFFSPNSK